MNNVDDHFFFKKCKCNSSLNFAESFVALLIASLNAIYLRHSIPCFKEMYLRQPRRDSRTLNHRYSCSRQIPLDKSICLQDTLRDPMWTMVRLQLALSPPSFEKAVAARLQKQHLLCSIFLLHNYNHEGNSVPCQHSKRPGVRDNTPIHQRGTCNKCYCLDISYCRQGKLRLGLQAPVLHLVFSSVLE